MKKLIKDLIQYIQDYSQWVRESNREECNPFPDADEGADARYYTKRANR